ncbi:MAG: sugar ABC transporter ATP-binding protein [Eubacteriales bacterium]|nr:sugar ABC transporter ATP-binding protein [Eubacteriales bacterium]
MELLKMEHIQKAFFGVTVLDDVSFCVKTGEVHALLGENGAGKSTLMNILAGVYTKDGGTVTFEGRELADGSISDAEHAGIAFVHQELNIFNDLKVFENLFLGKEKTNGIGKLKKKEMIQEAGKLLEEMGVELNPVEQAGNLDTGKKQLLEIAKALHSNAKLIILDEPTTALNNEEIAHLFDIIRRLKEKGTSFVFISHKMPEIFQIADRYTVLRNSRFIHCGEISKVTAEEVTRYMVGDSYVSSDLYEPRQLGDVIFQVQNISGEAFEDVDFEMRKGEIIGFTGLAGAGASQVMQAIFGVIPIKSGSIRVFGEELHTGSIHQAMKGKIAMVASNRKENSVLPDMTILENMYVSQHAIESKNPHIQKKKEIEKFEKYRQLLNIKANTHKDYITSLSGGNQQKVILARWLNTEAEILLFDNPTQGIDVGAKAEIYRLILKLANEGKTIIVNTLEIPEIQKIADRCIVFYHGRIAARLARQEINEETVMLYATNAVYQTQGRTEEAHG